MFEPESVSLRYRQLSAQQLRDELDEVYKDRHLELIDLLLVGSGGTGKSKVRDIMLFEHNVLTSTAPLTFHSEHSCPCEVNLPVAIHKGSPIIIGLTCCANQLAQRTGNDTRKRGGRRAEGLSTQEECERVAKYFRNIGLPKNQIIDTTDHTIEEVADAVLALMTKIKKGQHIAPRRAKDNSGCNGQRNRRGCFLEGDRPV